MNYWNSGDNAIAKITKRSYAKVRIMKSDEDGTHRAEKVYLVLAVTRDDDGMPQYVEELCYFVQIHRTKEALWIPATELRLAGRARPFYGEEKELPTCTKYFTKKTNAKEDHVVPISMAKEPNAVSPDKNTAHNFQYKPVIGRCLEHSFKEFVRRGTDQLYEIFTTGDHNGYLNYNMKELIDKLEKNPREIYRSKEVKDYLHKCWRFKFDKYRYDTPFTVDEEWGACDSDTEPMEDMHLGPRLPWCLVCGIDNEDLIKCRRCPASFHQMCTNQWFITVLHRKNLTQEMQDRMRSLQKQMSSVGTFDLSHTGGLCPSCKWGPAVGYGDIVWHKMKGCQWWPAKVLSPGSLPSCLINNAGNDNEWPLLFYGTKNHAWCKRSRITLFLTQHADPILLKETEEDSQEYHRAIMDASDDYVAFYLT